MTNAPLRMADRRPEPKSHWSRTRAMVWMLLMAAMAVWMVMILVA